MFTSMALAGGAMASMATAGAAAAGTAGTVLGMSAATLTNIALASTALSTAAGVAGAIQQGKQQSAQAKYQAQVAQQNANIQEQNASAERREGYENMLSKRQQASNLIAKQRAIAGASGTAVDVGSNLDVQEDTASRGEIDALKEMQSGYNRAYNFDLQASNYRSQAAGYMAEASSAKKQSYLNAGTQLVNGIASMGTTWLKGQQLAAGVQSGMPKQTIVQSTKGGSTTFYDPALQRTVTRSGAFMAPHH